MVKPKNANHLIYSSEGLCKSKVIFDLLNIRIQEYLIVGIQNDSFCQLVFQLFLFLSSINGDFFVIFMFNNLYISYKTRTERKCILLPP